MTERTKVSFELELPTNLALLALPEGVDRRLQMLIDRQDRGESLSEEEQAEADGLVELEDLLSLLRLRVAASRHS